MECNEVGIVLYMYRTIQLTNNSIKDKSGIDQKKIFFWGFDGNHEKSQISCMEKIIENSENFQDFEYSFNSHYPMEDTYKKMLEKYNELPKENGLMNKADLIELLDLAAPPR